jgi:hypothetical protein
VADGVSGIRFSEETAAGGGGTRFSEETAAGGGGVRSGGAAADRSGVHFKERMSGWISFDELTYNQAVTHGHRTHNTCAQELEIEIDDFDRFLVDPEHTGRAAGTVTCPQLGGTLQVLPSSTIKLFVPGRDGDARHKRMLYRLLLRDPDGRRLTLSGFKDVRDDPNLDIWSDTTRLFVRILRGHRSSDPEGSSETIATGILYVSHAGVLRMLTSFRSTGDGHWTALKFDRFFVSELRRVYGGRAETTSTDAFPEPTALDTRWQGFPPGEWHDLAGKPGVRRRILAFDAGDPEHTQLTLHHLRGRREPWLGPLLMIPGAGVRPNLFYGGPRRPTVAEAMLDAGYDVWVEGWRASIDMPPNSYTLDQAAVYDHPAAVRRVLAETGASTLKAVIHCQGSTSFTVAAVAGLVPEVTTIVSNAVSLHVNVPFPSLLKGVSFVGPSRLRLSGLDAQWAVCSPSAIATAFARLAHLIRGGDCDNRVCQFANYLYGAGSDLLWRHGNLDDDTHEWVAREFGYYPFSLLAQLSRSERAGYLVPSGEFPDLIPSSLVADAPRTDARWSFLAGARNRVFLPVSQRRSFEFFDGFRPGFHSFHELPGYTHLDVMFGRNAHRDVFPLIVSELAR